MSHQVLYGRLGLIDAGLPMGRGPHLLLAKAVLADGADELRPLDCEQIALQLTGHARAVASDVRRLLAPLPGLRIAAR